jgi:hypothetical protein
MNPPPNLNRPQQMSAVSAAEVETLLLAALDQADQATGPADFDRFLGIGISLAKAGREDAGPAALRWLAARVAAKRLDIVAAFLTGLWNRPYRSKPVGVAEVEALVQARRKLAAVDQDTEYSYAQALCRVLESDAPDPARAIARAALQSVSQQKFDPELQGMVQQRIAQALAYRHPGP